MKKISIILLIIAIAACMPALPAPAEAVSAEGVHKAAANEAALLSEYWTEGSGAASDINEYILAVTDEASPDYIPVEDALPVATSFPDFTLRTAQPLAYQGEKADGQPLFLFYPSAEAGVTMTAVNAVWTQRTEPFTAEAFTSMYQAMEDVIRSQYESGGNSLTSFRVAEAEERQFWGMPALVCDAFLTVDILDSYVDLTQRGICVTGPFGTYLFTLSAWSADLLEEATASLVQGLGWN